MLTTWSGPGPMNLMDLHRSCYKLHAPKGQFAKGLLLLLLFLLPLLLLLLLLLLLRGEYNVQEVPRRHLGQTGRLGPRAARHVRVWCRPGCSGLGPPELLGPCVGPPAEGPRGVGACELLEEVEYIYIYIYVYVYYIFFIHICSSLSS